MLNQILFLTFVIGACTAYILILPYEIDRSVCPKNSVGTPDKCICNDDSFFFDTLYWRCRVELYLPNATGIIPIHIPAPQICASYETGVWPNCEPIACGPGYTGFHPNCARIAIPPIQVPIVIPYSCPNDQVGTPPYCYVPCPTYQARINNSTECQKIPCPKAKGWTGDYMPYCDFTPVCPDNFPGVYPFCNKYGRKDVKQATNLI